MKNHRNLRLWMGMTLSILILTGCNVPVGTLKSPSSPELPRTPALESGFAPAVIHPSVEIIGDEELIYDWTTDRCSDNELPDLPVRAFRDGDGMIQLNLSFTTNYRMIGEDLDSLMTDCQVTLRSDLDNDPGKFNYSEWVGSTYTLDGKTVYALVHNEFYGNETSGWFASKDFGRNQGGDGWLYQGWDGSAYVKMSFDAGNNRWQGNRPLCQIGSNWTHPDLGCEPVRTWVSPVDATITISGSARDLDPGGGNGVIVKIFKGVEELWSVTIANGDTQDYTFDLEVPVRVGEAIHFRVNANGDTGWDATFFDPKINVGEDPCPSGQRELCTMYAVTFAKSVDGGKTFVQPSPPEHIVAILPVQYKPDGGTFGMWQPSNIVKNPKDGFYYALVQLDDNREGRVWVQGMCVMRTKSLDDPQSWRAWDGVNFNMRFVNPFVETNVNPLEHTCAMVGQENVGALAYNLTYNSYFDKFIAAGHAVNEPIPGFYYSLSDDLVHWTPKKLLMATDLAQNAGWQPPFLAYPSLIDPDSPSDNYDVTGQSPYMYYTRINAMTPKLDFDLLRVRIRFDKE
jgi:hypothetical protein